MPALAADEWAMNGMPCVVWAVMLTMHPPRPAIEARWISLATRNPPSRFVRITASKPLAVISAAGAENCPPALLTSPSMASCWSWISATHRSTSSGARMSPDTQLAAPPSSPISLAVASSGSCRRPHSTTEAPSEASS